MKEIIKEKINENLGISFDELGLFTFTYLNIELNEFTQDIFFKALEELISQEEIVEVKYVLPEFKNTVKSIYFPKGTKLIIA